MRFSKARMACRSLAGRMTSNFPRFDQELQDAAFAGLRSVLGALLLEKRAGSRSRRSAKAVASERNGEWLPFIATSSAPISVARRIEYSRVTIASSVV
jgi:hypothetical protein